MEDNLTAFDEGMKKAQRIIQDYLYAAIERSCLKLIDHALKSKEYQGFTGNTQTSYVCGIYYNGKLLGAFVSGDNMQKPVRLKIGKGQRVFLKNPYEGKARSVTGRVDVDKEFGADSAVKFLMSFKPAVRKGFSDVMTTGTEYSEYLENVRNLNVLTDTFNSSKDIVLKELKPMNA